MFVAHNPLHEHAFWSHGQVPMMGPPAQPNQVMYPIMTLPENKPRLSREQWAMLEHHFSQERKPSTNTKKGIAQAMNVPLEKINNWFQNRRAKERQEQKKAESAAQDGTTLSEPHHLTNPVGDHHTLPVRPASQLVERTHPPSLTPPLSLADYTLAHPQPALPSPSEEFNRVLQSTLPPAPLPSTLPTSLPDRAAFEQDGFQYPLNLDFDNFCFSMGHPMTMPNNEAYPSPDETVLESPKPQFPMIANSVPASVSHSPEGLHPVISHGFSERYTSEEILTTGASDAIVANDSPLPDIAFPDVPGDHPITSDFSVHDYPPYSHLLSGPSTPTFPADQLIEQHPSLSTQAALSGVPVSDFTNPNSIFVSPPSHINGMPFSAPSDHQSLEHVVPVMPPLDSSSLFKLRQSSQSSQSTLAARRRKNVPGAIQVNSVGSMGRSGSYTAGMPRPLSPRSPHLAAADQTLRRIKSSNIAAGRIQKPMTPAQRSPLAFAFSQNNSHNSSHNSYLLDTQTPPPSASIVEMPSGYMFDTSSICNLSVQNMQAVHPRMGFHVPFSAPPTQHSFHFNTDHDVLAEARGVPLTPSPTSQPQRFPS